ncbi:PIN domain-containing protein [Candidatus Parcubacteria bacterium]|nr:MAG: PIN domain-containing protein [Candidatus Parcubacteria bacterium]
MTPSAPQLTLVTLDETLAEEAAEIAADRGLRGADAVYVAVARRHRCILISLDREQRERGAAVVPTQTPTATPTAEPPSPFCPQGDQSCQSSNPNGSMYSVFIPIVIKP